MLSTAYRRHKNQRTKEYALTRSRLLRGVRSSKRTTPKSERLATSGSTRQHQQARGRRQFDRMALLWREGDGAFLGVHVNPALHTPEEIGTNSPFDQACQPYTQCP